MRSRGTVSHKILCIKEHSKMTPVAKPRKSVSSRLGEDQMVVAYAALNTFAELKQRRA